VHCATNAAVSTVGGAQITLNDAAVTFDLNAGKVISSQNWDPAIVFTEPVFTTGADVQLSPNIRWAIEFDITIFGQPFSSPTLTSETTIGFNSVYSSTAVDTCLADRLRLTSFISTNNSIAQGKGTSMHTIYQKRQVPAPRCFDVPAVRASPEEMVQLSASGQEFCTSYVHYHAPTVAAWTRTTVAIPSTVTSYTTTTITETPTIEYTSIISYTSYLDTTVLYSSTVTVTITNDATMPTQYLKRRDEISQVKPTNRKPGGFSPRMPPSATIPQHPSYPTKGTHHLKRVAVSTPALVQGWGSSQLSYACSQIATGTTTVTSTATYTTSSGAITIPMTVTENKVGPLETITYLRYKNIYGGRLTTSETGATTVTDWECPMQTQIPSCMEITVNGPSTADGRQLRYFDGILYSVIQSITTHLDAPGSAWYLSCQGHLTAITSVPSVLGGLSLGGLEHGGLLYNIEAPVSEAKTFEPAYCTMDPASKTLDCVMPDGTRPFAVTPASPFLGDEWDNMGIHLKMADLVWGNSKEPSTPVTLSYEEVQCPCQWAYRAP
jgi:hypothetical protein